MCHPRTVFALAATLICIGLLCLAAPARSAAAGGLPLEAAEQEQIDAYIQSRMRADRIRGLALGVVRGDQVVYLKGYGVAGPDGRAVTPQTPFILGSTSKSFTALAVMQLVESGAIDLDAPVTRYLPWFRTADEAASARITVRHLLHQSSGLPVYAGREGMGEDDQSGTALEGGVRQLDGVRLNHPAGQAFEYANENYTLLGMIVQAVSGTTYEAYVQSAIFAPLDMRHSAAAVSEPAVKDLATGYRYWFYWPVAFDAPYPRRMTPAGFLISSAEDMSQYLIAQLNGGRYRENHVLSPEGIAALHTAGARISPSSAYGMGWVIHNRAGRTALEHNGDVSNFHSNMLLLPDQQTGIVVLTNVNGMSHTGAVNAPVEGVAAILLGRSPPRSVDAPSDRIGPVLSLAPLPILAVWIVGWRFVIERWRRRGELPPRGMRRLWRYAAPLSIDLCVAALAWLVVPRLSHAPMTTISLFAPDAFLSIVLLTVLGFGWALARTILTLRPRVGG